MSFYHIRSRECAKYEAVIIILLIIFLSDFVKMTAH